MPLLTTSVPKDREEPEQPLTMIVTMPQLISQKHLNLNLYPIAHLKMTVRMIMCLWGKQKQEKKFLWATL